MVRKLVLLLMTAIILSGSTGFAGEIPTEKEIEAKIESSLKEIGISDPIALEEIKKRLLYKVMQSLESQKK